MTARQMLEDGGWTPTSTTIPSCDGMLERDGDLQFIAFYINSGLTRQESLEWINEASSRLNYVQMWLDEDEDVAVMYSVAEWDNVCPKNLSDHIKLFISLMKSVGELHPMNRIWPSFLLAKGTQRSFSLTSHHIKKRFIIHDNTGESAPHQSELGACGR